MNNDIELEDNKLSSYSNSNNISLDDFEEEHTLIKNIIKNVDFSDNEKMNKIIDIRKKISYRQYNLNYRGKNYYDDKFLYLISAEKFKK